MTATSWGLSGPEFLWFYGALCAGAATAIAPRWLRALGPREPAGDEMPDLGLYELATLGNGPDLAITSAASQLHRDGLLRAGPVERTLEAVGELPQDSDAVRSMTAELTGDGLLNPREDTVKLARRVLLLGGLLALLAIARIVDGVIGGRPVGWLALMLAVVVVAAAWICAHVPVATNRGKAKLDRWRDAHADLRRNPIGGGECALVAALFGAGALWLAAPEIALALGVERENAASGGGGRGGSCGGGGCGGYGGCGGGGG